MSGEEAEKFAEHARQLHEETAAKLSQRDQLLKACEAMEAYFDHMDGRCAQCAKLSYQCEHAVRYYDRARVLLRRAMIRTKTNAHPATKDTGGEQ